MPNTLTAKICMGSMLKNTYTALFSKRRKSVLLYFVPDAAKKELISECKWRPDDVRYQSLIVALGDITKGLLIRIKK